MMMDVFFALSGGREDGFVCGLQQAPGAAITPAFEREEGPGKIFCTCHIVGIQTYERTKTRNLE